MEEHPDSALSVLEGIDCGALNSKAERARYALLMSMALDKNYIDTTEFDVLQPAIDYYPDNGNPDEILKTYYYQGRIYQNQGDLNNALSYFAKAVESIPGSTDSLAIARALVAQGGLYRRYNDYRSYIQSYLSSYNIYKGRKCKNYESESLFHALDGAMILGDKSLTDSIFDLLSDSALVYKAINDELESYRLTYAVVFRSEQYIRELLEEQSKQNIDYDANGVLNLAFANCLIDEHERAKSLLAQVENWGGSYDTLKYQSIVVQYHYGLKEYKEALDTYMAYTHKCDSINEFKFNQKIESINERHALELKARQDQEHKDKVIWSWVGVCLVLGFGVLILLLLVRNHKAKKNLAMQRAREVEIANKSLELERGRLEVENKNLQLERDNKALMAENLANRVEALEEESENLKRLMQARELPPEVKQAMKVRIEMLNSFLASRISDNESYSEPYKEWIGELTANAQEFMDNNRLAFHALYPRFMQYLIDHGLTDEELNLVCLYAIGLKGKEVGAYTKKRSYANASSAIRKKLGIDQHQTNIGIYVRKMLEDL